VEKIRRLKILGSFIGIMFSMQSCFLTEVLPEEAKRGKSPKVPDPPVVLPLVPKPSTLEPARMMRRLSIDLMGTLPEQKDVDLVVADSSRYFSIAERLLNSSIAAVNISQLHGRMWGIRSDQFPDLDRFIAAGDSVLGSALTSSMRNLIATEPIQYIRFQYENKLPFSNIFITPSSFGTEDLMNLWGTSSNGIAWIGQPWHFTQYAGDRPEAGIIGSPAFLASIDSRGFDKKAFEILSRFNCMSMENRDVHLFYKFSASEMLQDLSKISETTLLCADCHRPLENANRALKQFSTGSTFDEWKNYVDPASPPEGFYNGKSFIGAQGWLNALKEDPRIHRCEAQKLLSALNQREYGSFDTATISIGLARYFEQNESLLELVRAIVFSEDYRFDTVSPAITGNYLRQGSGVRTLRRFQWKNILSSLHPMLAELSYPESLDPGIDEALNHVDMVPTGQYWSSVDRLVRAAAEKIVEEELSDTSTVLTRRVLTALADKSSFGVSTDAVNTQIRLLWQRLTSENIEQDFVTYTAIQTLWAENKPEESEEKFRQAWRVILIAMLSHPRFINY
jgi:hypothetical protein